MQYLREFSNDIKAKCPIGELFYHPRAEIYDRCLKMDRLLSVLGEQTSDKIRTHLQKICVLIYEWAPLDVFCEDALEAQIGCLDISDEIFKLIKEIGLLITGMNRWEGYSLLRTLYERLEPESESDPESESEPESGYESF